MSRRSAATRRPAPFL
ncbi:hypothetical protein CRUP_032744 [Coryphaenoides rupestris]|nr:hypothetical protein CRUP_032744 [Coryphaenoides rupestris]